MAEKGKYNIVLTGKGTQGAPLKAGNWTLTATVGKLEAEATFAVAGAPADVAVSASSTSSDTIGDVITVTATVTGQGRQHRLRTHPSCSCVGTLDTQRRHCQRKATKNGSASVKYAVTGAGSSVVSAEAGDATGVVVIVSTAGSAAAADEEVTLNCLSELNAFSVYTCETVSSASELFGLLQGLDVSAIHLWNGSAWLRYSVVDGAMVPGSTDFPVRQNQSLYISY